MACAHSFEELALLIHGPDDVNTSSDWRRLVARLEQESDRRVILGDPTPSAFAGPTNAGSAPLHQGQVRLFLVVKLLEGMFIVIADLHHKAPSRETIEACCAEP